MFALSAGSGATAAGEDVMNEPTPRILLSWSDSYRSPRVYAPSKDTCVLCGRKNCPLFGFSDNEGYGTEHLCLPCLKEAVLLMQGET